MIVGYIVLAAFAYLMASLWVRNNKIYNLRSRVNKLSRKYSLRYHDNGYRKFYLKLPSYQQMYWSFKPVKLETWFTVDEINELLKIENNTSLTK